MMIQSLDVSSGIRYKVLDVQRGFHSRFCEPMLADLEDLAGGLTYSTPKIQIERCSIEASPDAVTSAFIAQHTRKPVYFESAVKRVEQRLGACTWIEAGSGSSVTTMIRRALSPSQAHHHFFPVDFSHPSGLDKLAVTIATLGSNGYSVRFWPFHRLQRDWYSMLNLPSYQFEKTSHWLEFNLAEKQNQPGQTKPPIWPAPDVKPVLLKSCGSPNLSSLETSFIIDPRSEEYTTIVQGHSLLSNPVSPASLYIDIALQAARGLVKDLEIQPVPGARVKNLDIQSPLGTSQDRPIQLLLTRVSKDILEWDFLFFSRISNSDATSKITTYATGLVGLSELDSKIIPLDFSKFTALLQLGASASQDLQPDTNVVQGPLIYRLFSRVVDYHEFYRGVQKVTTSGNTIFSHVSLSDSQPAVVKDRLLQTVAVENFFQVPGFYFNCLHCTSDSAYICSKVDNIQFSPNFRSSGTSWDLISNVDSNNNRTFTADIFATDKSTGYIVVVAFGVHFKKVRLESLAATLASADVNSQNAPPSFFSGDDFVHSGPPVSAPSGRRAHSELVVPIEVRISSSSSNSPAAGIMTPNAPLSDENDLDAKIRETLSHLTGVPAQEIVEYYPLGTLGIDSLMSMEIVSELASELNVSIPRDCIQDLKTFASLRDIVRAHMTPNFSVIQERANKTIISYPNNAPTSQPATERNARTISSESARDTSTTIDVSSWVINLLRSYLPCSDNEILNMTSLEAIGLDSLMCMELRSDVERTFGIMVDATPLMQASSLEELVDFIARAIAPGSSAQKSLSEMGPNVSKGCDFSMASENFTAVSSGFESLALEHGFTGFYDRVYDKNSQLVLAYTIEAFTKLGVSLQNLSAGDEIPLITIDPRHQRLRGVLYEIIKSGGIANYDGEKYVRTYISIATRPSGILLEEIIAEFPQHANEHLLLNVCGSELSNLISGAKDPLVVLFGTAKNRAILEEVYSTSPMYLIMSQLLTRFLEVTLATSTPGPHNAFQIIEIGAGTGSTTKWVVDRLLHLGIPIEYTFTDISGALVSAGRRKFSQYSCMRYATIDIEKEPPTQYLNQFDIVLATNCIHATKNLRNSLGNIYKLLRPSGFVSLVEFTSRMFWFDLVFGLLEGWWRFDDGRSYVLASPEHWEQCMQDAGFSEIAWTGGSSRESEVVRVITGYKQSSAC
ncbi:putative polyketide synthase [Rosellinia necatrix]|uniref:Putative polyketide synthase n=1 Tax=Rosellinia necatrix TaxID=77044 RepID=A0A1W2TCY4_ROSNE|nr:putative polyketide synthase [Rosellinia necatrix]